MTTSTLPDGRIRITLEQPGQMIVALPHLLGFRPENSLVVAAIGSESGQSLSPLIRLDLPPPEHEEAVVAYLEETFARHPGDGVAVVAVGAHPQHPPCELPHGRLIERLGIAFEKTGIPMPHPVWTPEIRGGARWRCYTDECEGVLPDEKATEFAALCVSQGRVTYDSLEEMARTLAPDDKAAVARRAKLLRKRREPMPLGACFDEVRRALLQARKGELGLSDDQVVRLADALGHSRVRDTCLSTATESVAGLPTDAEKLWLELVRRMPPPERAECAALLGYAAYVRGEGALARMALDNALEADPGHVLSGLLLRCLKAGIPPERVKAVGDPGQLGRLSTRFAGC
ncbi:DUF4192 domain-containing protein [Amycolatopsis acidicola]|uniref:DUF4192 domain-containing protein n=1 Tax=Amycolatopsis acidicola TaxID=2596893 RepID=A0A5N0UI09_9PSEU|nr:DUF4192 domain-containing protein [Amycolatopsis acidicola]KAA9147804.1 DUF4192 domain-containing protein [Amycolatopsis acidicola]